MSIPVLLASGKNLPEAWENSLVELYEHGIRMRTEYDKENDPPSIDSTMIMVVNEPLAEPRIHLSFPGGFIDLRKYEREVVNGVHDHWIDPKSGKWTYTYHGRFFKYPITERVLGVFARKSYVNQIDYIVDYLSKVPYSRRVQATTWDPQTDPNSRDPPCLQRIWLRCVKMDDGRLSLNMQTSWRSRDAYKAAFMNKFALTSLQAYIAKRISEKIQEEVVVGQYVDFSNSYHIYGADQSDFEKRFLSSIKSRKFYDDDIRNSRTIKKDRPVVVRDFEKADEILEKERLTGKKGMAQ